MNIVAIILMVIFCVYCTYMAGEDGEERGRIKEQEKQKREGPLGQGKIMSQWQAIKQSWQLAVLETKVKITADKQCQEFVRKTQLMMRLMELRENTPMFSDEWKNLPSIEDFESYMKSGLCGPEGLKKAKEFEEEYRRICNA